MAGGRPPWSKSFTCPNCEALYEIVKVEAGPETIFSAVTCRVCGAPVPNREDNSSSNTSCCEKRVVFKGGAPIESPASFRFWPGLSLVKLLSGVGAPQRSNSNRPLSRCLPFKTVRPAMRSRNAAGPRRDCHRAETVRVAALPPVTILSSTSRVRRLHAGMAVPQGQPFASILLCPSYIR
jgi:hypothetical protein